ncbi:MAG TPA: xanthine dehydrogenase family protein subunit M [Candidatus Limnocylindria bacterium]|nr:xanthine dehydrogenase family protein subunit M [Candidatus Limnocylindria bacterium]
MFEYARPTRLDEAVGLLVAAPGARPLLGGTDLIVGLRKGRLRPPLVVDLKRVAELDRDISERDGMLRVGAAAVMTQVARDARVRRHFPALVEAALTVGSIQIRNRATLAGNLCNASPAADTAPPLLVYGARVEVAGRAGRRVVPVEELFVGPGRTSLAPGELVTAVELPLPNEPLGAAFGRLTRRRGVDLATINLCCSVSAGGVTRFAYGAAGPRPFLVADTSGTLADASRDEGEQERLLGELTSRATPISNVRASREYREAMLVVLSRRALARARARLAEGDGRAG